MMNLYQVATSGGPVGSSMYQGNAAAFAVGFFISLFLGSDEILFFRVVQSG
jgi:hypothetical protein